VESTVSEADAKEPTSRLGNGWKEEGPSIITIIFWLQASFGMINCQLTGMIH